MSKQLIHEAVTASLQAYFKDLGSEQPANVYAMLLDAFEYPLLACVMDQTNNNQSKAAQWLGLNRNTLRKKLQHHRLSD
jgi:Fis family transcriptional regulator